MEEGKGERYLASGRQYGNALLGVRHQEEAERLGTQLLPIFVAVTTGAQRCLPINTQYSTYSKLMVTVSLAKISPCSRGCMWVAFGLLRAKVIVRAITF